MLNCKDTRASRAVTCRVSPARRVCTALPVRAALLVTFVILAGWIPLPAIAEGESASPAAWVRLKIEHSVSAVLKTSDLQIASYVSQQSAEVQVTYEVVGNHDRVVLGCVATDLYKAFIPASQYIVPLDKSAGCRITAAQATHMGNSANVAGFGTVSQGTLINLPAYETNGILYESGSYGSFTMDVDIKVNYDIDLSRRTPVGNYGGYVKLYLMSVE